jgi:hypothetical protein
MRNAMLEILLEILDEWRKKNEGLKRKFHLSIFNAPIVDVAFMREGREGAQKERRTRKKYAGHENPAGSGVDRCRQSTDGERMVGIVIIRIACIPALSPHTYELGADLWSLKSSESRTRDVALTVRSSRRPLLIDSL